MSETQILDRAEISGGNVIVQYGATEAALAELRQKHQGVVFDLTTTRGDKEARAARLELVTLRTSLEKKRKEFKAPALEFGKKIDAEAARITCEIVALEKPIDEQIAADEARREAIRAEKVRIEAERVAAIQARISAIRACLARCNGISAERIANGIAQVEAIAITPEQFAELVSDAETAKAETLAGMRELHAATMAREQEAARLEAQRVENERIAAEQRAEAERLAEISRQIEAQQAAERERFAAEAKSQADALAAQQAEIDRQRRELEAAQARAQADADAKARAERDAAAKAESDALAAQQAAAAAIEKAQVAPLVLVEVGKAIDDAVKQDLRTLKLGAICELLGLTVTADFLAQLGFVATVERNAKLYRSSDYVDICAAISAHVTASAIEYVEAA